MNEELTTEPSGKCVPRADMPIGLAPQYPNGKNKKSPNHKNGPKAVAAPHTAAPHLAKLFKSDLECKTTVTMLFELPQQLRRGSKVSPGNVMYVTVLSMVLVE
ncbi:hypothetical protein NDU88_004348 [Pleurodeles waltl]|uniref:Uncharacterized protein n=1 Tax=Pleurodeles waltl TaxID=8319 RepID=A0AAV7MT74_PLEWA|nr:hypothetical protein NDU88_004348 [Pleurodeles waltl]